MFACPVSPSSRVRSCSQTRFEQRKPQTHVGSDHRGPAGDAASLVILRQVGPPLVGGSLKERRCRPRAWNTPAPTLSGAGLYHGELGRGKGWVGVGASSPQPIYTSRERSHRGAEGAHTSTHKEVLSPLISQNICSKVKECGKKRIRNNEQLHHSSSWLRYFLLPTGI